MKFFVATVLVFLLSTLSHAHVRVETCKPETQEGPVLYTSDFKWNYSFPQMLTRFGEVYQSDKRLKGRAYVDPVTHQLMLPYEQFNGGDIVLPVKFVEQVAKHIEAGFRQHIVDAVFFPDMGHSHFFIPLERFKAVYDSIPVSDFKKFYETFFADPSVKILYHTAEQLKQLDENNHVLPDPVIQNRYKTRNLIGPNDGSSEVTTAMASNAANTLGELAGYEYWGAGFNLSANKNGCFSYEVNGQTFYFDISMYDLGMDPNDPGSEF